MLKIHISNIKEGEHEYEFVLNKDNFDFSDFEDAEIIGDVTVNTKLYKSGNQFDLKSRIKGCFRLKCDRCLDDYAHNFENNFEIIYKFDFLNERDSFKNEEDEIKLIPPRTGFIDITDDVRDYLLLSVPMKKAPEEINGRCVYCNRNITEIYKLPETQEINPVWSKLLEKKIKKK